MYMAHLKVGLNYGTDCGKKYGTNNTIGQKYENFVKKCRIYWLLGKRQNKINWTRQLAFLNTYMIIFKL